MIKASKLVCLICLAFVATVPLLKAQTAPVDPVTTATDEAIHRQADRITLDNTLKRAKLARDRGDLIGAYNLYEKCYGLMKGIGAGIDLETSLTMDGLTKVLMDLARQYQKHQDYKSAEERFNRILVIDPLNQEALAARRENERMLAAQAGTIPSPDLIASIPAIHTNEIRIATLVRDGKFLYEAGKLDEAEVKLNQAYTEDPSNVAAYQYLQLIRQRRMADASREGELRSGDAMIQVEKGWTKDVTDGVLNPRPNLFARTNLVHTGPGREAIISKLDRIRVDSVKYDNLPLGEVINNLAEIAKSRDPDRTGINFFIDRQAPASASGGIGATDPNTGLQLAPLPTEAADITAVTVKISPGLNDVRLADVLDAITKTADKPIKYSVLEYAVIFSLKGSEATPLEFRTFRVDPNTFRQGLQSLQGLAFAAVTTSSGSGGGGGGGGGSGGAGGAGGQSGGGTAVLPQVSVTPGGVTGGGGTGGGGAGGGGGGGASGGGLEFVTSTTNLTANNQTLVRAFFAAVGVDLNTNNPANAGKAFAWNDRKGILMVRATSTDLDIIEAALQALNQAPPEINIKSKFIEITQNDNRGLGFNWTLGGVNIGNAAVASGGTQPSFNGVPSTVNPEGVFPGSLLGGTSIPAAVTDGSLTQGLRQTVGSGGTLPTVGTITGILTNPQFRVAINALEQRDGVDELNAPEVTTESGRQAQIQAVDVETIVTGNNVGASGSPTGVTGVANGVNSPIVSPAIANSYTTTPLPFGPVLDVIPYVSADEYSVQMTLVPTVTEFVGYDNPGLFVPSATVAGQSGNASVTAQLPLPHFRLREVTTSVTVWDAQTVVLGGLLTDTVTKLKDKVPMLGDLPLVGRLFQSESSSKSKKNLMIFVTPTIINPDGTRFHSDEEMPFNQNIIQPARPMAPQ